MGRYVNHIIIVNSAVNIKSKAVQNVAIRTITGVKNFVNSETLHNSANMRNLYAEAKHLVKIFFNRNQVSKYPHPQKLGRSNTPTLTNKLNRPIIFIKSAKSR